jgi:hypothetical protein
MKGYRAACGFALLAGLLSACGAPSGGASLTPSPTLRPSQLPATVGPGFGTMAYDGAQQRLVLFGGPPAASHTWTWDGTTWVRLAPPTEPPIETPKLMAAAGLPMAYDELHHAVVLLLVHPYGIDGPPPVPPDTWTWDGITWTKHPTSIPAATDGRMVYSGASKRVVLLGTVRTTYDTTAHMWSWTGSTWEELHPAQLPPTFGPMADDAARGQVVTVIPSPAENPPAHGTETWTWDGLNWSPHRSVGSPPASTGGATAIAYDADRKTVVMFGGLYLANSAVDQTWTWDGTTWTMKRPAAIPPARFNHAMAYDAATHSVVLTGGAALSPSGSITGLTDSWTWDGVTWTRR